MKLFKSIIRTVATFAVAVSMVTANVSAATVPLEHTEKNATLSLNATRSKTLSSITDLSLYLTPGGYGDSNVISFNFAPSIPSNAIVTKIEIHVSKYTAGGKGIILAENVTLISPNGDTYVNTWSAGLNITIYNVNQEDPSGIWKMYFTGTNLSSKDSASLIYSNPSVTLYYTT